MNVAQLLINGMKLSLPGKLRRYIETGLDTYCAITGEHLTTGIEARHVIPASTGEYLDLLHGLTLPYLSIAAATAYKGSWNLGSRLIFEDGTHYHPFISAASANKSSRTYWSALVRDVYPAKKGIQCTCIITADFKKRIWPRAAVGALGNHVPVLLYDTGRGIFKNLFVDWRRLIEVLEIVEEIYTAGYSKEAIVGGLYTNYAEFSADVGLALDYEARLEKVRHLAEFKIAILIAQKGD